MNDISIKCLIQARQVIEQKKALSAKRFDKQIKELNDAIEILARGGGTTRYNNGDNTDIPQSLEEI